MTQIMIEAYKYQELDDSAKETVKYWYNQDMNLWEDDSDYWLEELKGLGYTDIDFQFSGFSSQGDGASIVCKVDLAEFIKRNKLGNKYASLLYRLTRHPRANHIVHYASITRARWGHYVHDNLLRANADDILFDMDREEDPEETDDNLTAAQRQVEEILPAVLQEVREWSRKIYKSLEADYFDHFTDEYMIDACEANGYLFDQHGKPVHHLQVEAKEETVSA